MVVNYNLYVLVETGNIPLLLIIIVCKMGFLCSIDLGRFH